MDYRVEEAEEVFEVIDLGLFNTGVHYSLSQYIYTSKE